MSTTATIDRFLNEISNILRQKNGSRLQDYLIIEPPYSDLYQQIVGEVRNAFAKGREDALENKCSEALPEARDGEDDAPWTAFIKFMVQYFAFLRDVNVDNMLDTFNILSELVQKCNSALVHPTLGIVILPTVVSFSRMLSRLAIGLDKQPELIAHLVKGSTDEGGAKETLPERAANIVRQAFVTCLNDRNSNVKDGSKKIGIYKTANLCLKVLFQCRKTRNAEQIFVNIDNQSPSLAMYPRAERVTYLYYLGRYLFSVNHFYRAQRALQEAYTQCHTKCLKQRRLILIYLISSNMILGRFPSHNLYGKPEAAGLMERFHPLCKVMASGNLASFRQLLDFNGPNAGWFLQFRVLLQLRNRGEVIVWRSLIRKTFLVNGNQGDAANKKAPTLSLQDVLMLLQRLEQSGGEYIDPDLDGVDDTSTTHLQPDMLEVESIFSSLIDQGLLNGYISHRQLRFAIQGAKQRGALAAGFPNVWSTISAKADERVPGWKEQNSVPGGGYGGGMVVNLSGARPAGSAAA